MRVATVIQNGVGFQTLDLNMPIYVHRIVMSSQAASNTQMDFDGASDINASQTDNRVQAYISPVSAFEFEVKMVIRKLLINQIFGSGPVFIAVFYDYVG